MIIGRKLCLNFSLIELVVYIVYTKHFLTFEYIYIYILKLYNLKK
jgi:hypothetical protein